MSSRGQVVIPKAIREAARIGEGDEIEVVFDGEKLVLAPCGEAEAREEPGETGGLGRVRETGFDYVVSRAAAAHRLEGGLPPSRVWADRIKAAAALKRLRAELPPMTDAEIEELLAESRRDLEERGSGGGRHG
jgi:AbrB family looped-hinge helix DNA binding protein